MSFLGDLDAFLATVRAGEVRDLQLSAQTIARHVRRVEGWFLRGEGNRRPVTDFAEWLRRFRGGLLELMYEQMLLYFEDAPEPAYELVELALAVLVEDESQVFTRDSPGPDVRGRLGPIRAQTLSHAAELAVEAFRRREAAAAPSVRAYCGLLRLTRRVEQALAITPAGELLRRLPRREQLRWLLALELTASEAPREDALLRPVLARKLLAGDIWLDGFEALFTPTLAGSEEHLHREVLDRWTSLGLLSRVQHDPMAGIPEAEGTQPPSTCFSLTSAGRGIFEDLLAERPHPLRELAQATRDDQDGLPPHSLPWTTVAQASSVSSLARYTQILTHEVRNALLPVQFAVEGLAQRLVGTGLEEPTAAQRATIEVGLRRIFEFVDEWLRVAEQGRPRASFPVLAVVRDAVAAIQPELERAVELRVGEGVATATLVGEREQFTRAIGELLRNALQQAGAGVSIAVSVMRGARGLVLEVCDDGPGVAESERARIFERGVTTRREGAGQGLALVREIVGQMSGAIRVEDSSEGGARFVVEIADESRGTA